MRTHTTLVLSSVVILLVLVHHHHTSSTAFNLKKYNDIWERALGKTMSKQKLVQLKKLLHKFDRTELEEKHKDMEERNDGEEPESKVEEHLNEVLKEYDLLNHKEADFADPRLNELWRHAMKQGDYSDEELHNLHAEMQHMDAKMNRVHENMGDLGTSMNSIEENLVDADTKVDKTKKMDDEKLGKQFKEMKDGILKKSKKPELKDERVQELWDSAQSEPFSEDELGTIREELVHFQRYIDKMEHWEGVHNKLKEKGGTNERAHAEERLTEYKRKVKKFHKTMVAKIEEKTEL